MQISTPGIVLRKVAYSGSSAVVTVYTRRYGQVPFMVRGISRKSGKSAAIQPLSRVEISCSYREKNQVQSASSVSLRPGSNIASHPLKAAVALFLAEMLYKSLREESPDEDLFDFIDASLDYFEKAGFNPDFHLVFLMHLTRYLGFYPSGNFNPTLNHFDLINGGFTSDPNASLHMLDPELVPALDALTKAGFESDTGFKNTVRRRLLRTLTDYYRLHLEGMSEIKSLDVLTEIFSS